jgi:hypothetical protein
MMFGVGESDPNESIRGPRPRRGDQLRRHRRRPRPRRVGGDRGQGAERPSRLVVLATVHGTMHYRPEHAGHPTPVDRPEVEGFRAAADRLDRLCFRSTAGSHDHEETSSPPPTPARREYPVPRLDAPRRHRPQWVAEKRGPRFVCGEQPPYSILVRGGQVLHVRYGWASSRGALAGRLVSGRVPERHRDDESPRRPRNPVARGTTSFLMPEPAEARCGRAPPAELAERPASAHSSSPAS